MVKPSYTITNTTSPAITINSTATPVVIGKPIAATQSRPTIIFACDGKEYDVVRFFRRVRILEIWALVSTAAIITLCFLL